MKFAPRPACLFGLSYLSLPCLLLLPYGCLKSNQICWRLLPAGQLIATPCWLAHDFVVG